MKANELRIGNWVNVPVKEQSPFRIDAFEHLSDKFIKVAMFHPEYGESVHPLTWYGGDLEPIPLTEEILLKCGFEEDANLFHNNIALYKNGVGGFNYNANYFEHDNLISVDYLHQLQNLYFALTGEELKIEL